MGVNTTINYPAMQTGNAGNPESFDIITSTACDFIGKIVACFESLDANGGTFSAMEEETISARAGHAGVSTPVAAKYLTYTYPKFFQFMGRYTKLVPSAGYTFKVYFLK